MKFGLHTHTQKKNVKSYSGYLKMCKLLRVEKFCHKRHALSFQKSQLSTYLKSFNSYFKFRVVRESLAEMSHFCYTLGFKICQNGYNFKDLA